MALADTTRAGVDQELREAMLTGRLVDWRTGDATSDDPTHGAGWDAQRTVAAALLAELLTNAEGLRRPRALRLTGARIVGQLNLEAAELVCPLLLESCWFAEPVVLDEARAPALRMPGCHLPALSADQLTTRSNLGLDQGFTSHGEVRLLGAHIGGQLVFDGATLTNPDGLALNAASLRVDQGMYCREGFTSHGEVRLLGAHIGGQLVFDGATLTNPDGDALNADSLRVDQGMYCREGFTARGEVRLRGAHIGGQLAFVRATVTNPNGYTLNADRLTVDQHMFCSEGFTAHGELHMLGAHIGGQLAFVRATVTNPNGRALNADSLIVAQSMYCQELAAHGELHLRGAHIGGQLNFNGATLTNPDGRTLNLQELRAASMLLRNLAKPPELVDLTDAKIGALVDDSESWPRQAHLDGFVYDALYDPGPISARQRLGWLARNPDGYSPQPYEQLAAVYRRSGRDEDARTVAIAKQRARRRTLGLPARLWSLLLDGLVGYGYRTWLAGVWLVGFWLVGWMAFDRAHAHHELVLAKPGEAHSGFHGAVYSLDTLLPVVDLRQQAVWIPSGWVQWWAWASILAGWILTTAVVAVLTGLLKRD